jgi:hypothetical protein
MLDITGMICNNRHALFAACFTILNEKLHSVYIPAKLGQQPGR